MLSKCIRCGNYYYRPMFVFPAIPGARLTREQVLFSWALGEAYSPRWREETLAALAGTLHEKLTRGETRDFSEGERQELIRAFSKRRENFIRAYIDKAADLKTVLVPGGMIGKISVIPTFGWKDHPVTLAEYAEGESREEWKDDPRQAVKKLMQNPPNPPYAGHPIVAHSEKLGVPVLIDGYARCIHALWEQKKGKTPSPMLMIFCLPPPEVMMG